MSLAPLTRHPRRTLATLATVLAAVGVTVNWGQSFEPSAGSEPAAMAGSTPAASSEDFPAPDGPITSKLICFS